MSRFAQPGDQLILSWQTPWGSGGHRRVTPCAATDPNGDGGGAQTWPGVGGEPPLVVMAESLNVRFTSAATGAAASGTARSGESKEILEVEGMAQSAWGFRLIATGREVSTGALTAECICR